MSLLSSLRSESRFVLIGSLIFLAANGAFLSGVPFGAGVAWAQSSEDPLPDQPPECEEGDPACDDPCLPGDCPCDD